MADRKSFRIEVLLLLQNPGIQRARVAVVGNRVPAAKHEVLEAGERNEVFDERGPAVGTLAQPNPVHLGQGADGLGETAAHRFHAGDERRGDGPETGQEYAELAFGRTDLRWLLH